MTQKVVQQFPRLMGKKCGMTQMFDESGALVACTVVWAEPNVVTQIKTKETDGYDALQFAYDEIRVKDQRTLPKRSTKPLIGHFAKAQVAPARHLMETRVSDTSQYQVGQKLQVTLFQGITHVDVQGVSKGRGYQGVMRLFHFKGGPASHGSGFHRHAGSTGMRSTPGRCLPGGPRPSHMGAKTVTTQSLRILAIDETSNLLFIEGSIPGAKNGLVIISGATKVTGKKLNKTKK